MTSKEKAVELFLKIRATSKLPVIDRTNAQADENARRVLLLIVREIIGLDVWYFPHNAEYGQSFWCEVRQHIEGIEPGNGIKHLL